MEQKISFRKLRADEVEVRIGQCNKGGVSLLLYKDARCDQNILDEQVGAMNWQRHHSRDNANCVVAIWDEDKKQWIEKEDTGIKSAIEEDKGLASDSFKRACVNWGIGRELYTAPDMFIPKERLKHFSVGDNGKPRCFDEFKVTGLEYEGNSISYVEIAICEYGKAHNKVSFGVRKSTGNAEAPTTQAKAPVPAAETPAQPVKGIVIKGADVNQTPGAIVITDDTVIKIGNCRGKKYGEVKDTETFAKFLGWVRTSSRSYEAPEQTAQFDAFKKMVMEQEM